MNESAPSFTHTPDQVRQIELHCDQFEADWKAHRRPLPEAYLRKVDASLRPTLLRELLLLDWEYRVREGDQPTIKDYVARFPHLETLIQTIEFETASSPPASLPLQRLAQYRIVRELGRGGMGVVYEAEHESLGRHVAIKVLRSINLEDSTARERFRREAQMTARLQHPNIVQIYEVGEHDRQPYLALEYVDGPSLSECLNRTPQPASEAAALVRALALAVHYAHAQGIVHRDLKPANVLLSSTSQTQRSAPDCATTPRQPLTEFVPKVTDFGLAQPIGEGDLTATGVIIGTPAYMAPEQAWGKSKQQLLGPSVDIYALGAILYEALTGHPVFQGINALDALEQVRTQAPVPPARLQPSLPRDLETICLKCLAKEPEARYASAQALADDLGCYLMGSPISARRAGTLERTAAWCRRNKPLVAVGALAVVALLSAGALALNYAITAEIRREQQLTQAALRDANFQRRRAEQTAIELNEQQELTQAALARAEIFRRQAEQSSANYAVERGLSMLDQGHIAHGMLLLGRSLQLAQPASKELEHVIRTNLSAASGRLSYRLDAILEHGGEAQAVVLAPGGRELWTGGRLSPPRRFDPVTGLQIGDALPHPGEIRAIAVSQDGRLVATAGTDKTVRLWDTRSGQPWGKAVTHKHWVQSVAFSPDAQLVLTGSADGTARLWDAATGDLRQSFLPPGWIQAVAFHPDGRTLALAADVRVWLYEAETGKPIGQPLVHQGEVWAIAYSPDGQLLLTGCEAGTARLWDATTGQPLGFPLLHQGPVHTVGFVPGGAAMWSGDAAGEFRLWDAATLAPLGNAIQHETAILAAAVQPDLSRVATGSADGKVRIWTKSDATTESVTIGHERLAYCVAVSPDGRTLATGTADQQIRFWDAATGEAIGVPVAHDASILSLAFSADGEYLVSGSSDKTARIWQVADGAPRGAVMQHDDHVYSVTFSPDGKRVATGAKDNTARIWNAVTGEACGQPLQHSGWVHAVEFSPDGRWLLTGCENATAQLWDANTGQPVGPPLSHRGPVRAAAFSPDGKVLATGTWDEGAVRLWDAATGQPLGTAMPHQNHVLSVEFSPNGKLLATGSWDGAARLWDVATGKPLGAPMAHKRTVRDVSFSPDGVSLWTASFDRTVRSWPLPQPVAGNVDQTMLWIEVLTGTELNADGLFQDLDATGWQQRAERLRSGSQ